MIERSLRVGVILIRVQFQTKGNKGGRPAFHAYAAPSHLLSTPPSQSS